MSDKSVFYNNKVEIPEIVQKKADDAFAKIRERIGKEEKELTA